MKGIKKSLAMILALIMVLGLLPMSAFASGLEPAPHKHNEDVRMTPGTTSRCLPWPRPAW